MNALSVRTTRIAPDSPLRDGIAAIVPMTIGVAPFGLVLGATIAATDIDAPAGLAASLLLCAGSAQLSTIDLIGRDASALIVIAAALLINLRFLAYSAATSASFPTTSRRQRAAIAFPLVDQMYLTIATDPLWAERTEHARRRFYAGAASLLVTVWVVSQIVGYAAGGVVPDALSLHLAAPLSLAGLLAKATIDRSSRWVAVIAALIVATSSTLLGASAVLVAIVAGVTLVPNRGTP